MNRRIALIAVAVVLVGVAGIAAAGPVGTAVAQDGPVAANETSEGNGMGASNGTADISPGERLSGVIGVQRAEVAGEVDSRAFEVGLNRTGTDEERAALVAERLDRIEERLSEIERRQRELRERRDAGELTQGEFAARMAETGARAEAVKREANRSAAVARDLPEPVRAAQGLDSERMDAVRERANGVSGPEVSAIARGVAGDGVGQPLASERRGPPAGVPGAGAGTENATGNTTGAGASSPPAPGKPGDGGPSVGAGSGSGSAGNGDAPPGNATPGSETGPNGAMGDGPETNTSPGDNGADGGNGRAGSNGTPSGSGPGPRDGAGDRPTESGSATVNTVAEIETLMGRLTGSWADSTDILRRVVTGIDG
ncbi:DUF7096 domain-containing protein [Halorubrum lacusprofundi]|jgi:hypothetical protein|uniref:DUF7096 domain-containing protein n=1 Tax=Halorubrum lacusprofundi (strain ATCC 49239 / DSM 5036 / JCM 8891 / ACAM 34) TaxID=416348 RepID=B9LUL9_HALLT|nr:hypothetical protein [Halorubrum lacusprofundi]ACM56376.1 conserved hypothetical protein [Halorubrum lacusprofundi ATCC 49239]MCG1005352.1 hypothetical protein [Halorubrum lacusprofundi]